jgi:hypothetical protein
MDVSHRALEIASQKLRLEDMPAMQKGRIRLIHGSLTYQEPLRRVHECVFGVLALESEPVDPRL